LSSLQFADINCAQLLTPQPNRFIGHEDAAFRQKILRRLGSSGRIDDTATRHS
jgi:hypothetical protein